MRATMTVPPDGCGDYYGGLDRLLGHLGLVDVRLSAAGMLPPAVQYGLALYVLACEVLP